MRNQLNQFQWECSEITDLNQPQVGKGLGLRLGLGLGSFDGVARLIPRVRVRVYG